jgi:hypothetical protein
MALAALEQLIERSKKAGENLTRYLAEQKAYTARDEQDGTLENGIYGIFASTEVRELKQSLDLIEALKANR